MVQRVVLGP